MSEFDHRQQLPFVGLGRQIVLDRMEATGFRRPALAGDVSSARRIVADQDDRETRRQPMRDERSRLLGDASEHFVGDRRAVKHEGGRVIRGSSVRSHVPQLCSGRKTKRASWRARPPGSSTRMPGLSNRSPVNPSGSL